MILYLSTLSLAAGLLFLALGGKWLFQSSISLALRTNLPTALIGMTVMAIATSSPELFVTLSSSLVHNQGGVAIGNILGSNIFNLLCVLGSVLIFFPSLKRPFSPSDFLALMVFHGLLFIFLYNGELSRVEGLVLSVGLGAWLFVAVRWGLKDTSEEEEEIKDTSGFKNIYIDMAYGIFAIATLALGTELSIWGGLNIAHGLNIPEYIIGLTVLSVGTSLPELASCIVAARHGHTQMAVGNIVGSNLINIAWVAGLASVIHPIELPFLSLMFNDWAFCTGLHVLIGLALWLGRQRLRLVGAACLLFYAGYVFLANELSALSLEFWVLAFFKKPCYARNCSSKILRPTQHL